MRVVVLASGRGSNLGALIAAQREPDAPFEIVLVAGDKPEALALRIAEEAGIETLALDPRGYPDRASFDADLFARVAAYEPELIVLAGFMRILDPGVLAPWVGRMINIHPSLLPKYRGLKTHERAIKAGDAVHGASVHFVTPELDGGPVISQVEMPLERSDTPASLATRLLPLEHRLLSATVDLLAQRRVTLDGDGVRFDGTPLAAPLRLAGSMLAA
ncbi:MAG TPA: phosphoribosylglycinamide formyltransferase [Rhodanobacteraceae bacterium]|nr:phosphoribosylglycinamide formyltransferase [Rhodanobacteraceae bacterium]